MKPLDVKFNDIIGRHNFLSFSIENKNVEIPIWSITNLTCHNHAYFFIYYTLNSISLKNIIKPFFPKRKNFGKNFITNLIKQQNVSIYNDVLVMTGDKNDYDYNNIYNSNHLYFTLKVKTVERLSKLQIKTETTVTKFDILDI